MLKTFDLCVEVTEHEPGAALRPRQVRRYRQVPGEAHPGEVSANHHRCMHLIAKETQQMVLACEEHSQHAAFHLVHQRMLTPVNPVAGQRPAA
ncbi:MAG: hypothetical protein CMJ83_11200 [Planctomycetes bacterium]|nr:hypothetical protein [Planctomycetota bacterium]